MTVGLDAFDADELLAEEVELVDACFFDDLCFDESSVDESFLDSVFEAVDEDVVFFTAVECFNIFLTVPAEESDVSDGESETCFVEVSDDLSDVDDSDASN